MRRNKLFVLIAITILLINSLAPMTVLAQENRNNAKDGNRLLDEKVIEQFDENEFVKLLVILEEQVDSEKVRLQLEKEAKSKRLSREHSLNFIRNSLVQQLQATASNAQKDVTKFLEESREKGLVKEYTNFFIVNGFSVTTTQEIAEELLTFPEVKSVLLDEVKTLEPINTEELSKAITERSILNNSEWHIDRIKAPEVWDKGITGKGVVVANIDSGVDGDHPALKTKYRGYNPEDPDNPNHEYNWFDPAAGRGIPLDSDGHGTHTMGTMVGYEEGVPHIGVAPGAEWIAARAFYLGTAYDSNIIAAGQWILAPTDERGRPNPEMAPDIVNNSWGGKPYNNDWFRPIVQAWKAAGIVPIFSVGNAGLFSSASPGSASAPANYPESIAIGATDQNDQLASFSLRGPTERGDIKPDLVAPGVGILSSVPGERWDEFEYEVSNGTSMAAPQVAGTAALLKEVDPTLTVDEIETILKLTATKMQDDEYDQYPNNGYGYGMLNSLAAVEAAEEGIGTITGQIHYEGNDDQAPTFEHDIRKVVFQDMDSHFSIRALDNISVNKVTLHIELDHGEANSYLADLVSGDHTDGIYEVLISSEDIYGDSLTYYWEIEDFSGQITFTEEYSVEVQAGVTNGYYQDFESYPDGWYSFGRFNSWEWGEPSHGPDGAASGDKVMGTNLRGLYAMDADMTLMMPPVIVEEGMQLRFKQWYALSWFGHDKGKIFISEDGESWDEVYQITNDNKNWHEVGVDLSAYAGKKVFIAFNLTSMDNEFPGWYIDDVQLTNLGTNAISPKGEKGITLNEYPTSAMKNREQKDLLPAEATITVLETGWTTSTDLKDGSFEIHHTPGTYTLQIEAYGFETVTKEVMIRSKENKEVNTVLEKTPTELVTGRVKGIVQPIEGAHISFVKDGRTMTVRSNKDGEFTGQLMEGTYDLFANARGYQAKKATIDVTIGEPLNVDFELQPFLYGNEDEIKYDNGRYDKNLAFGFAGSGFAVKMSLSDDKDAAMLTGAKLQFWAGHVPVPGGEDILISVYDATGVDGSPGRKLAGPVKAKAVRDLYQWTEVDLSHLGLVVTDDFYILYQQADNLPYVPGFVADGDRKNAAGRSWDYIGGEWFQADESIGNYMIRALVDYGIDATDIQEPIIISPTDESFVKEEETTIEGIATPNSSLQLVRNDEIIDEGKASENGNFSFPTTLIEGINDFSVVQLVDDQPFIKSENVRVILITKGPELALHSPEDGTVTSSDRITVAGEVIGDYVSYVTINGEDVKVTNSHFSKDIFLNEGRNEILVLAGDLVGNITKERLEVFYEPFEPKIISITPNQDVYARSGELVNISVQSNIEGGEAYYSIKLPIGMSSNSNKRAQLDERKPGIYEGSWIVPHNLVVEGAIIEVEVIDSETGESILQDADGRLFISDEAISRIKGDSRFGTAVEISKSGWQAADTVILARNDDYADALAGVPLAHKLNAPILLTRTKALPEETLAEIKRLEAEKVIILGGSLAISDAVLEALEAEGLEVERIYGKSRTDTAVEIAKRLTPAGTDQAIVVSGWDFPDALSVASHAALNELPILLTHSTKLSGPTADALVELGVRETFVIGGTLAVGEEVLAELPNPERISGKNRIETNIAVQEHFGTGTDHLYVATGNDFADSLTGAVLAARNNSSILLVRQTLTDITRNYIKENKVRRLTLFGGTLAISEEIELELDNLLK